MWNEVSSIVSQRRRSFTDSFPAFPSRLTGYRRGVNAELSLTQYHTQQFNHESPANVVNGVSRLRSVFFPPFTLVKLARSRRSGYRKGRKIYSDGISVSGDQLMNHARIPCSFRSSQRYFPFLSAPSAATRTVGTSMVANEGTQGVAASGQKRRSENSQMSQEASLNFG